MRALTMRIELLVDRIRDERALLGLVTSETARDFMFTDAAISRLLVEPGTRLPANEERQFNEALREYLLVAETSAPVLLVA